MHKAAVCGRISWILLPMDWPWFPACPTAPEFAFFRHWGWQITWLRNQKVQRLLPDARDSEASLSLMFFVFLCFFWYTQHARSWNCIYIYILYIYILYIYIIYIIQIYSIREFGVRSELLTYWESRSHDASFTVCLWMWENHQMVVGVVQPDNTRAQSHNFSQQS